MSTKENQFKQLFEENKDRVFRICCLYVRSSHNRDDLFQEIFTNIWKNLGSFRNESHVNTWIYRISINTAINYCRLQNNNDKRCQEIKQEILSDDDVLISQKTVLEKDLKTMFETINRLPVLEKSFISLVLEGLDHARIAEIVGISEGNVRVKFHRIKKKLKQMMEEQNNEL
ncbi:RNA polymerase sigma factor [Draconibacterium sp. IB214405]|uniref:RNA polymerase sigma factor n=1 Tax=Draconibacterium sp. IB214405 TaxID=3097352 RepID=UPI002A16BF1C|nr:RNA polymerase sigma factor [Draconibacterium sp. IB214405]MDX8341320.1 RNA polymerase sigma factor [Draconibacterium sp. IB214405]